MGEQCRGYRHAANRADIDRSYSEPGRLHRNGVRAGDDFTDSQRAAVDRAARKAAIASRQYGAENDAKLEAEIKELSKGKVAFNDIDLVSFKSASKPIAVEIGKVAGEDFTAKVMKAVQ